MPAPVENRSWPDFFGAISEGLAQRDAEVTCELDDLRIGLPGGTTDCALNRELRVRPQGGAGGTRLDVDGRLDGTFAGAPVTVEAGGSTLLVRAPLYRAPSLRRAVDRARPLIGHLNDAGVRVKVKFGALPAFGARR